MVSWPRVSLPAHADLDEIFRLVRPFADPSPHLSAASQASGRQTARQHVPPFVSKPWLNVSPDCSSSSFVSVHLRFG